MNDLIEIKKILDEALWFIEKPLVERVRLLREEYAQQQQYLENAYFKLSLLERDGLV